MSCKSNQVQSTNPAHEPKEVLSKPQPELLRLGYDVAYRLPKEETLLKSTSLQPTGVIYEIQMGDRFYRVSSTNSENREQFPYWKGQDFLDKAKPCLILYPNFVNGSKAGLTLAMKSDEAYARWEWNYQGTLLVIESVLPDSHPAYPMTLDELKVQGEALHSKIKSALVLY